MMPAPPRAVRAGVWRDTDAVARARRLDTPVTTKLTTYPTEPITPIHLERIAAAVNSHPEGEDPAVLATAIPRADSSGILSQEHRQLVVCGSSHRGDTSTASIGHTTRQLVQDGHYALAIAARGLSGRGDSRSRASASATTADPKPAPPWHGRRRSPKGAARTSRSAASSMTAFPRSGGRACGSSRSASAGTKSWTRR